MHKSLFREALHVLYILRAKIEEEWFTFSPFILQKIKICDAILAHLRHQNSHRGKINTRLLGNWNMFLKTGIVRAFFYLGVVFIIFLLLQCVFWPVMFCCCILGDGKAYLCVYFAYTGLIYFWLSALVLSCWWCRKLMESSAQALW